MSLSINPVNRLLATRITEHNDYLFILKNNDVYNKLNLSHFLIEQITLTIIKNYNLN